MQQQQIYQQLTEIFHEVFDDDSIVLRPEMTAHDLAEWDSFNHINLIIAAEGKFKVRFQTAELEMLQNVGHFVELIERKLAAQGR